MGEADELAAVLCHEMGHVAARHLSNRIEQNKKMAFATLAGLLAGALIGGKAAGAIMTGTMAANMQQQLNYSREDERQADQLGFKYMSLSGSIPGAWWKCSRNWKKCNGKVQMRSLPIFLPIQGDLRGF